MNHFAAVLERKATADRIVSNFNNLLETISNGIDSTSSLNTDVSSLDSEHVLTGEYLQSSSFFAFCVFSKSSKATFGQLASHPATYTPFTRSVSKLTVQG